MRMINRFCRLAYRRKALIFIQTEQLPQVSDSLRAGFELTQNLSSDLTQVQTLLKLCSRDNHYTTAAFTLNANFRDFIETSVEHFLDIRKNPFWWENYGKEFRRYIQKIWFDKTSRDTFGRFCYVICGSRYFASKITLSCREFHPF